MSESDSQLFRHVTFDFSGHVALVTGVGSETGIGRAILRAFARSGAMAAGCDNDAAALAQAQLELPQAFLQTVDVRNAGEVTAFVSSVMQSLGRVDFLINCAGIANFSPLLDLDESIWNRTFDTNVKGYFLFAQAVVRQMIRMEIKGVVVNVSSISAHQSGEHKAHYCASKAAVGSLTKGMALEFSRYGIRVNAIEPGTVDTPIVKEAYIQPVIEAARKNHGTPINRMATGDDMAGAALFLCSGASSYMTGASILVDGGALAGSLLPDSVIAAYKRERIPTEGDHNG
jgi:NAD(P)-dependent dehydrogenase (short-subunit alcohol dehydrogenase family)